MNKNIKNFGIAWVIGFALFNAVTFIIPNEIGGINRFEKPVFWVSYALIVVSFMAQLALIWSFCKKETGEKKLLGIPFLGVGYMAVALSLVVGCIFMIVPVAPAWIGAVVCLVLASALGVSGITTNAVAEAVEDAGETAKGKTAFMRGAIAMCEELLAYTNDDGRSYVGRVCDALRYSDIVSLPSLAQIEGEIQIHLDALQEAVTSGDIGGVKDEATQLLALIEVRSSQCMAAKK